MTSTKTIGFIGLGAMGYPMVARILQELPDTVALHVFDVNASVIEEICNESPKRVTAGSSAKDVTDKSVSVLLIAPESPSHAATGRYYLHGS